MKNKIISLLKNTEEEFVSGEKISEQLGITRAAIWKYMKMLKEDGYLIEAYTKKGYKLISSPDLLTYEEISNKLTTSFLGRNLLYYKTIDSTNNTAKNLANEGALDGTVLVAEKQTSGRGRLGRQWVSPEYKGIYTSFILRPKIEPMKAAKITQITAAAAYLTFKEFGIDSSIKWPNDIIVNGKKVCGILTELNCELNEINYLVVGIGINVNLDSDDFTEEISKIATSLKIANGKEINRKALLATLLNNFEKLYLDFIENENTSTALEICKSHSAIIGKDIKLIRKGEYFDAKAIDITDDGNLVVEYPNKEIATVFSGEVSVRIGDNYI